MKTFILLAASLCAALLTPAQAGGSETPLQKLPYTPSLDPAAMDRSVDPCEDLYQFSCGGWMQANPIPADQSRWSVYAKLANENQRYLWGVLQGLAEKGGNPLGDYFAACMDEEGIEAAGLQPLARAAGAHRRAAGQAPAAGAAGRAAPRHRTQRAAVRLRLGPGPGRARTRHRLRGCPAACRCPTATITSTRTTRAARSARPTWPTLRRLSACWARPTRPPAPRWCCGWKPHWRHTA
jgi:hypothetical protein